MGGAGRAHRAERGCRETISRDEDRGGLVARAVVGNEDQLRRFGLREQGGERDRQNRRLVVGGDEDAEALERRAPRAPDGWLGRSRPSVFQNTSAIRTVS